MEEALRKAYEEAMKIYEQAIAAGHAVREATDWVPVKDSELYQRLWEVEDKAHQAMTNAWTAKDSIEKLLMEKGWL